MNTKEAIDIICIGREELLSIKGANNIVNLLRELEKYRQEDLKTIQFYIKYYNMWNVLKANTDKGTIRYMNKLEQKYFPKEDKSDGS